MRAGRACKVYMRPKRPNLDLSAVWLDSTVGRAQNKETAPTLNRNWGGFSTPTHSLTTARPPSILARDERPALREHPSPGLDQSLHRRATVLIYRTTHTTVLLNEDSTSWTQPCLTGVIRADIWEESSLNVVVTPWTNVMRRSHLRCQMNLTIWL